MAVKKGKKKREITKEGDGRVNSTTKTFYGYKPYKWQKAIHCAITKEGAKGCGKIFIVKAKRQIGKSYIIINELLRFAINYYGTISAVVSPTLNQSRKIYTDILNATEATGILKRKNDSLLELLFINGSKILFKSAEQKDNLRGFTISGILCIDEAAYITDEVFNILTPTTDVHSAPILIVSTPRFKEGFFYRLYEKATITDRFRVDKSVFGFDLCQYDTSILLSPEKLEFYRQNMPKNQFRTEYLGEFLDDDSMVFMGFKDCLLTQMPKDYKELYIGIDWGTGQGQDYTAMSVLNERGEQVYVNYFNNKSINEQIRFISEYIRKNKKMIRGIVCESNSIGTPMISNLRTEIQDVRIDGFVTSNKSKNDLVTNLQIAFEKNKIWLQNDDKQLKELSYYSMEYNPKTGNVSYNAPLGLNDDTCIALMLSWYCLNEKNKRGNYVIR